MVCAPSGVRSSRPAARWRGLGLLAVLLMTGLTAGGCRSGGMGSDPAFSIFYFEAGLVSVEVRDRHLMYIWTQSTVPPDSPRYGQVGTTVQRSFPADLDAEQLNLFAGWVKQHRVLDFPERYPPTDPASPRARLKLFLRVRTAGQEHATHWDGTSVCPELTAAVDELVSLAEAIRAANAPAPPPIRQQR